MPAAVKRGTPTLKTKRVPCVVNNGGIAELPARDTVKPKGDLL